MFRVVFTFFVLQIATSFTAFAQELMPSESEAARLGLKIHWLKSAESFQPNFGIPGAVLWPDRVEQNAYAIIRSASGNVLARIDAKDRNVDYSRYGLFNSASGEAIAPLGVDGIKKVADKIAGDYKLLGRTVTVEQVVRPVTYLGVLSDKGGIQLFDAESGKLYWSVSMGDGTLPVIGPVMSNEIVGVLVGSKVIILNKKDGKILSTSKLRATVSALPVAANNSIIAPQVNGSLEAYDLDDFDHKTSSLRFTDAIRNSPVVSANGNFVSWASRNHVYTARFDDRLTLWSRLETVENVADSPVVLSDGLLVSTQNGSVIRLSYERLHNIVWRTNIGYPVLERPLANNDIALISSSNNELVCLNLSDGSVVWEVGVPGIVRPLCIGKKFAYFQDQSNGLIAISLQDGKTVARTHQGYADGLRNDYSDRLYLRSRQGQLMCLAELELTEPQYTEVVSVMRGAAKEEKKPATEVKPETVTEPVTTTEESNTDAGSDASNPFGAEANPFGNDAPATDESNPFGN
jgi:outer membrane protein assembly factor BamB